MYPYVTTAAAQQLLSSITAVVAAARAAVATGAWVKSKHDMYLKCGSLSFILTHPPEDFIKS